MAEIFRPAARLVVINEKNQVLLVKHNKFWALPGGGIDWGETLTDALRRESVEELNIEAQPDRIIFLQDFVYPDEKKHFLEYFFTIKNNQDFQNVKQEYKNASHAFELVDVEWFDLDDIDQMKPIEFIPVLRKYLENKSEFQTEYISRIENI